MATLTRAIQIATEAHDGQVDKGGAPYILHPLRVMLAMKTDEERIVAVLHDVLEDCPASRPAQFIAEGFSEAVVSAMVTLTRRNEETYGSFIERVARNDLAARVKIADMRDNLDLSRIPNPTRKDRDRADKYLRYLAVLNGLERQKAPTPKDGGPL